MQALQLMNSTYSDYLVTADKVLDGSTKREPDGEEHRWSVAYAHEDSTFEVTSDTMFDEDGDAFDGELISVGGGSYYYMYAKKITHKTGKVTYYRKEAV